MHTLGNLDFGLSAKMPRLKGYATSKAGALMRYAMAVAILMAGVAVGQQPPTNTNELKALTGVQALALAKHEGELRLNGLTTLSDEAAKALAQHKGALFLGGLTALSGEQAKLLAQHNGALFLSGLTTLSENATKALAERLAHRDALMKNYKENSLKVRSLLDTYRNLAASLGTTDSAEVDTQRAKLLDHLGTLRAFQAQLQQDMSLIDAELEMNAATRRSGAAAESPVVLRMRREIMARQLEQTTKDFDEVADEVKMLGQANADLMARKQEIEQLMKVTDEMGVRIDAMKIHLGRNGLATLSEEQAKLLAQHKGALFLSGLTTLSDEAALWLGRHEGDLFLNGLTTLSNEQAECLLGHKGDLFLDGLTALSGEAASALMRANPDVWLPDKFRR